MRKIPGSIRGLLWSLGLLYAIYLVAGNVFLNSPLARAVFNRRPQTVQMHWSWAWTIWPGQIVAHSVHMHGHSHKILWSVKGDRASGRILLSPLFHRELRFGPIRASSVLMDVQRTTVDHQPPPWHPDVWRITFDGIGTTSLQRAILGDLVIEGQGTGKVGFTHQLRGGPTRIFPSRMVISDARLRFRKQPLLHDARLDMRFAVDSFTHDQPTGWHKAQRVLGHLIVEGATPSFMARAGHPARSGPVPSAGRFTADFSFDHGVLLPGGSVQWDGSMGTLDTDSPAQQHTAHLGVMVGPEALSLRAQVLPARGGSGATAADSMDAQLQFASRRVLPLRSFADTVKLLSGSSRFHWHFASLDWLTPLIVSKPWLKLNGSGEADGSLQLDGGELIPGSRVEIPQVSLSADVLDNRFSGKAHALARVTDGAADAGLLMDLTADRFTLASDSHPAVPYLRGRALQLNMRSSRNLTTFGDTLVARLHFDDADIPDLRAYNHYLPGKSLHFLAGTGKMSTDVHMDGKGDVDSGSMQMSSHGARLALGPSRLSGNLRMDTRLSAARRAGHAYDLDLMTLALDGIRVEGSNDPPWWARFTIKRGHLDWDRPMRLQGHATMVMKDVSLLLSLFADRGAFPKWIARVIDDGEATAHAQVDAQRGDFILDQLVASNERVDLFAHLRVSDGKPNGDLYVRWGVLGLGVELANGDRKFHLLHAKRWYQSQPNLLPPMAQPKSPP